MKHVRTLRDVLIGTILNVSARLETTSERFRTCLDAWRLGQSDLDSESDSDSVLTRGDSRGTIDLERVWSPTLENSESVRIIWNVFLDWTLGDSRQLQIYVKHCGKGYSNYIAHRSWRKINRHGNQ